MNEGMTIVLNLDEKDSDENEALLQRIDEFLLHLGIEYTGFRNVYRPINRSDRDSALFTACHALEKVDWLKDRLVSVGVMNQTNVCPMEKIQLDYMKKPSPKKLNYYEAYCQSSHKLAHGIVVDEYGQLRDGYTSYILAKKYGISADICEAFAGQPLKKIVRGRHVLWDEGKWKVKNNHYYTWNYTLKHPVVPGDILRAKAKRGQPLICVDQIAYVTGKEFCKEHKNIVKHMKMRLLSSDGTAG